MKVLKIDGKNQQVFVLKETEDSLVYIPVKSLIYIDYTRLLEIEKKGGEMLREMSRTTLDNGRNALVQYDSLIQVLRYTAQDKMKGTRLIKPDERAYISDEPAKPTQTAISEKEIQEVVYNMFSVMAKTVEATKEAPQVVVNEVATEEPKPARKKPGPKPKARGRDVQDEQTQF